MSKRLSTRALEEIAAFFEALSDPKRLEIVQLLRSGDRTVGEIAEALSLSQPTASRHLARLEDRGILRRRRESPSVFYGIGDSVVVALCDTVCSRVEADLHDRARSLRAGVRPNHRRSST